jgi:Tetratricopeptide repeat
MIRRDQGRLDEADDLVWQAATTDRVLGRDPELADCLYTLGIIRRRQGRTREAADALGRSLDISRRLRLATGLFGPAETVRSKAADQNGREERRLMTFARQAGEMFNAAMAPKGSVGSR